MQARGRGNSSYREGRGNPSYIGGREKPNNFLAQFGDKKLIASNISELSNKDENMNDDDIEEYFRWKLQKRSPNASSPTPSFASIVNKQKEESMVKNPEERVILLLNENDNKREDQPWTIYERYLSPYGYTMKVYKTQRYYEMILEENHCEVTQFTSNTNKEVYNFSKIIIRKVISMDEWGISPYKEKPLFYKGSQLKYNYWDYIQAFNKAFLYENDRKSHTWFIKISPEVYNQSWPSWFTK